MPRYKPESWTTLFNRNEQALIDANCGDALSIASYNDLRDSLYLIANEYRHQGFPDIVTQLEPGLRYLDSFHSAITSASQYDPRACLVWGAVQAFVQSAVQSNVAVEDMLSMISELNASLPEFGTYLLMFPNSPPLQAHFQDIVDTYMEYCIASIKYMKKSPSLFFITYLFGTNPVAGLKKAKEQVQHNMRLFERAAKFSMQKQKLVQNIGEELTAEPLAEPVNASAENYASEVEFPLTTVTSLRNFAFLGRENELADIRDALHPLSANNDPSKPSRYGQDVACCILQGLGGIGKTQTALEYTFRYREDYDAIFWVRAEMSAGIASAYAHMSHKLGLIGSSEVDEGENQGQAIELTKKWLSTTKRNWLVVYDNVESIDDIVVYLPQTVRSKSAMIITTQKTEFFPFTENFTTIQIKDLTRDQGADLLYTCLRRGSASQDEREYARKISDLLGGLPLALTTIAGYMFQTKDSIPDFFDYLQTSCNAWTASAIGPAKHYEKTLATVFKVALKELPSDARTLIDILAFLNPDHIPERLFIDRLGNPQFTFLASKPKFSDTIRSLRNRQLVGRNTSGSDQYLTIHRTVQMAVLHDLSSKPDIRRKACDQAFELVKLSLPVVSSIDNPEPGAWTEFQKYVPHILTLRAHCVWPEPPMELTMDFAQVLSDMATFMWHAGLLAEGIDALRTAEHILDVHNIGIEHHLRGNIHEHIAIFASHMGVSYRDESMDRRHKAIRARNASHKMIEMRGSVTRDDEIRLWNVQSDMAFGLVHCEKFTEAGQLIEECHDQYKQWGTPKEIPFEYLKYNHIISHTHMAEGRVLDAIRTSKEGARLGEICSGITHPMTLKVRFTMANHLYFAGMIEESLEENLKILKARIDGLGEVNPFTLESHSMCGKLYTDLSMFDEAESQFLTCLDPYKRSVWDEESTTRARYLYGIVLQQLGRGKEAEIQLQQARVVRDRYLAKYPHWLTEDPNDELAVFDQMVCMWSGRYTGGLKQLSDLSDTVGDLSIGTVDPTGDDATSSIASFSS